MALSRRVSSAILLASWVAYTGCSSKPPAVKRLYVFGDSYSDIGEGYLDGNGPTAVAYFAKRLGLSLLPSNDLRANASSIDFAVSGAQTGRGEGSRIGAALLGWGMQNQVDDFADRVRRHKIHFDGETTLFFLAGGLNDGHLSSATTVSNLEGEVKKLYSLGARRFRVALLPTSVPSFRDVGKRLNPEISRIPPAMMARLAGSSISLSNWGLFFDDVMNRPGSYGITDTNSACAGREIFHQDTTPCPHPERFFYYHAGHPSTAVHKIVGEKLYEEFHVR